MNKLTISQVLSKTKSIQIYDTVVEILNLKLLEECILTYRFFINEIDMIWFDGGFSITVMNDGIIIWHDDSFICPYYNDSYIINVDEELLSNIIIYINGRQHKETKYISLHVLAPIEEIRVYDNVAYIMDNVDIIGEVYQQLGHGAGILWENGNKYITMDVFNSHILVDSDSRTYTKRIDLHELHESDMRNINK